MGRASKFRAGQRVELNEYALNGRRLLGVVVEITPDQKYVVQWEDPRARRVYYRRETLYHYARKVSWHKQRWEEENAISP
jgi:hypothetical protein